MKYINIRFSCSTDGDFDFKNEDRYFDSSYEHYVKGFSVERENLEESLLRFLTELNNRVFNRYNQHQGLVDYFKNLNMDIFKEISFEDFDYESVVLLSGNQYVEITLESSSKPLYDQKLSYNIQMILVNFKKEYLKLESENKIEEIKEIKEVLKSFIGEL